MATAAEYEQPQALPTAALAYKRIRFQNLMDNTSHLKGNPIIDGLPRTMGTWRPTLENGWYYLGQGAAVYHTYPRDTTGVIVHALEHDALRDVTSWERVWTDKGSGSTKNYALWRGVPPNWDYVVLGGILSSSDDYAAPDSAQTYGIKAIRRDLLTTDDTMRQWWYDDDKRGNYASVWRTDGTKGIATGAMIPMPSLGRPPEDMGLSLDPSKVLDMTSFSIVEGDATTSESANSM